MTPLLQEKPSGGSCFRTKTVNALKDAAIGQVIASRTYAYSGTGCTPASYTDTWYKYNDKGDPVATVDDIGNVTSRIDMEGFGKVHTGSQYPGPRLTTKEVHPESGLYYFGARWYDAGVGRWIELDPVDKDGPNRYHFNLNNPVNNVDFDGNVAIAVPVIGGIAVCKCVAFVGSAAGAAYVTVCLTQRMSRPDVDKCQAQWEADLDWCDEMYTGRERFGCHARANANRSRCTQGLSRLPRKSEVYE